MACAIGLMAKTGSSWIQLKNRERTTMKKGKACNNGVKYHPDVCRGSNCKVQFHEINEAYDILMSNLRGESNGPQMYESEDQGIDEPMSGMDDPEWDLWEEWMGWEGAGIRDYSSHVNPYI